MQGRDGTTLRNIDQECLKEAAQGPGGAHY